MMILMGDAEKETPYSLRTQLYLSVQSASLVLDGPNNTQVSVRPTDTSFDIHTPFGNASF